MLKVRFLVFLFSLVFVQLATGASAQTPLNPGDILASDQANDQVLHFDDTGALIGTFGAADATNLTGPTKLAFDSNENVYVSEFADVHKFDGNGTYLGVFATGAVAVAGMAFDSFDNLYLTSGSGTLPKLRKYNTSGTLVFQKSLLTHGGQNEIAIDGNDVLYLIQNTSGAGSTAPKRFDVTRYDSDGNSVGIFGAATDLTKPSSLILDDDGNLYIAIDGASNVGEIWKYDSAGVFQEVLVEAADYTGPGPAQNLFVDASGNLFATDSFEDDVQS